MWWTPLDPVMFGLSQSTLLMQAQCALLVNSRALKTELFCWVEEKMAIFVYLTGTPERSLSKLRCGENTYDTVIIS